MRTQALLTGLALTFTIPLTSPAPPASAVADGCTAGVSSDINGDGWADAVVADPMATVSGQPQAGRIVVLYGDADGRVGEGARAELHQNSPGVGGGPEAGDHFGAALATADLDCDGYTDVVVGVPGEDIGGLADVGWVQVIRGAAGGLGSGAGSTQYSQASFGQVAGAGDEFGYAVDAVEDLGQGGTPEPDAYALAIGVPGADSDAGALAVRAAFDGGSQTHWITQDSPGVPGASEPGDRFGAAVSCNYLSGLAGEIDCVVGVPKEKIGNRANAGSAVLVEDIYYPDEYSGQSLSQNAPGVPGTAEAGDLYGSAVDTVLVGGTARIAIGAPGEGIGSRRKAGTVQLFSSNTTHVTTGAALNQNTPGVAGVAEKGDRFGSAVAWIAPGLGDPRTRLAVGVPREDTTQGKDTGLVQVFRADLLSSDVSWTQQSPGVPGIAQPGDRFGEVVATIDGGTERVLLVGVPRDKQNPIGMVNVIPFGGGVPRAWVPGGSIPDPVGKSFGSAIGGVDGGSE